MKTYMCDLQRSGHRIVMDCVESILRPPVETLS